MIIDQSARPCTGKVLKSFAAEEWLCRRIGQVDPDRVQSHEASSPLLYLWRHANAFVLGLRDGKLPYAREYMKRLEEQGCSTAVRHSGGAAVPLDDGVVNVSLIVPKAASKLDFEQEFRIMYELIRDTVVRLTNDVSKPDVKHGEIAGSYCPGSYDMSIGGLKFSGLAQRRQVGAIIIQAFVLVEGDGQSRIRRAVDFYDYAVGRSRRSAELDEWSSEPAERLRPDVRLEFPIVRPGTMASLSELVRPITVAHFSEALKSEFRKRFRSDRETDKPDIPRDELEQTVQALESRYLT